MIGEAAALAAIRVAFADPEPIIYRQNGIDLLEPLIAIRSDVGAPTFEGVGATLRKIIYEVQQAGVPGEPSKKKDSFSHRGRRWAIQDVTRRDDIGAWELIVSDAGVA